jgi:MoxR-like ATPase
MTDATDSTMTSPDTTARKSGTNVAEQATQVVAAIETEVAKVIVGQRPLIRAVLVALMGEGHALVEGVPGLGKTELIKALGTACGLQFSRIQFTSDLMPADIVGTQIIEETTGGSRSFVFRPGPVFAGFVLADEINRATPKTQAALLEAMAERTVTAGGATRQLPRPFLVMATQNPIEMEGTYPLPEAQLDRFMVKAYVPFPTDADLRAIVERTTSGQRPVASTVTNEETLRRLISLTRTVPIASHLVDYTVALVRATQPLADSAPALIKSSVRFGSSPRGAQALVLASKALALMQGRPNVSAADVREAAPLVLRHRLVMNYGATASGVTDDSLIDAVIEAVDVPGAGLKGAP